FLHAHPRLDARPPQPIPRLPPKMDCGDLQCAQRRPIAPGYFAMVEQRTGGPEPDVVTLELNPPANPTSGGTAVDLQPPKTRFVTRTEAAGYARKANRITIRHPDGDVVAILEIVSPGNKDSRHAVRAFARKAVEFLEAGVH